MLKDNFKTLHNLVDGMCEYKNIWLISPDGKSHFFVGSLGEDCRIEISVDADDVPGFKVNVYELSDVQLCAILQDDWRGWTVKNNNLKNLKIEDNKLL